ncbi:MAG: polysaccharide biosynthesis/export protein [Pyrinomonadaceae bacterium]|jgi:polysaccharide export outer membrane protein|nr:polysaccharide biosynthesis/export protein [Pyrinomonadaceae bacterium]
MILLRKISVIALLCISASLVAYAQTPTPARPPRLTAFGVEERYVLHPGDVLGIEYRYTPEFNQTVSIQPDGFISLQMGGDLKVAGRNLQQVRNLILARVRARLESPELTVVLREFQKPYVVVSGEVAAPGKFELRENLTAIQAVLLAGGFKDSAKSSQILVFRKLNADTAEVRSLNFKTLKRTSDLENDLTLQPGDMILVPRNRISKIERYVRLASLTTFLYPLMR